MVMSTTGTLSAEAAVTWIGAFGAAIDRHGDELTELDRLVGDGDFGVNLRSALVRARATLNDIEPASVGEAFTALSAAFMQVGGTSGPLFGMRFRELAK